MNIPLQFLVLTLFEIENKINNFQVSVELASYWETNFCPS